MNVNVVVDAGSPQELVDHARRAKVQGGMKPLLAGRGFMVAIDVGRLGTRVARIAFAGGLEGATGTSPWQRSGGVRWRV